MDFGPGWQAIRDTGEPVAFGYLAADGSTVPATVVFGPPVPVGEQDAGDEWRWPGGYREAALEAAVPDPPLLWYAGSPVLRRVVRVPLDADRLAGGDCFRAGTDAQQVLAVAVARGLARPWEPDPLGPQGTAREHLDGLDAAGIAWLRGFYSGAFWASGADANTRAVAALAEGCLDGDYALASALAGWGDLLVAEAGATGYREVADILDPLLASNLDGGRRTYLAERGLDRDEAAEAAGTLAGRARVRG